ncbi:hypothetical protein [Paenibacillus xylaniclasticus]|uniref:hypothetical protein n=1 Tax=Paenibacillus xylaniclasticus TaxID=588083 RepID=UPI000FD9D192|nr:MULTISPECIES: hypothetical protein [Paenibacillus]GFN32739.1 hypothetical protein PCURB6_29990 [Paenibacillus curdlanolyticus]
MSIEIVQQRDSYIVRNGASYFKLGIMEGSILVDIREGLSTDEIIRKHELSREQFEVLQQQFLSVGVIGEPKKEKFNIFFIKIPLWNPDRLFARLTAPFIRFRLLTQITFWVMNLFILIGLYHFFAHYDSIERIALQGFKGGRLALAYVCMISCVILHEMGHAFMCRYFGGKVSKIGLMLLFFSPAMYCDVSSAWLFEKKRGKIAVALGGIYVQLVIIAVLIQFFLTRESQLLSWLIFTNVYMIVTNLIPFVKLDGYWVLSHGTGISNLYSKSLERVRRLLDRSAGPVMGITTRQDQFILVYGLLTVVAVATFMMMGLYSLYYVTTHESIPMWIRIMTIILEVLIYVYIIARVLVFAVSRWMKKREEVGADA